MLVSTATGQRQREEADRETAWLANLLFLVLEQWFLISLSVETFNNVPHVVVIHNHNIFLLLLHNYNLATVTNHKVKYLCFLVVLGVPCERGVRPKGVSTHSLRIIALAGQDCSKFRFL